jgi:hypothetical protein
MPLTSPDGYLDFTNAVPRAVKMVATSNVGIGTSAPEYALDVHGTSNTGPLTVSSLTIADGAIEGDLNISGNLVYTSNTTTIVNSNVVVEYTGPHGRDPKEVPLKKYPEIVFDASKLDGNDTTNTYTQAGYTVTASSQFSGYHPWEAFDEITGNGTQYWSGSTVKYATTGDYGFLSGNAVAPYLTTVSDTVYNGEWIQLELPHKLKLSYVTFFPRLTNRFPRQGVFAGSNDGTNWDAIHIFSGLTTTIETDVRITTDSENNTTAYKYIRLVITHLNGNEYAGADNIKLYGYEEDPPAGDSSLDTTFTSVMNTPQTTGANVYVDAKLSTDFTNQVTGPTPTGTSVTHNDTGKYWELTGELTSNITVEANTFLEGDQPHAVSVWFNSSNLEANVSNTCVFSVSDQEKLDSQNLDLQSNTWHNLTYAYQGEGGSRVTYLDGRKVSEDQAEDTFGEYPPFAMTGFSQGGYVVNSARGGAGNSWKVFNNTTTDHNDRYYGLYDATTPYYLTSTGNFNTTGYPNLKLSASSGTPAGDWISIEMPYKLKLDTLYLKTRSLSSGNPGSQQLAGPKGEAPRDFEIWGTNDSINWYLIKVIIDAEAPNTKSNHGEDCADPRLFAINASKSYKKFAMIVTRNGSTYSGATATSIITIGEMSFNGHRENDLVRLPDPTRVLKYPHIAMTGPAQRGYVASSSGFYSDSAGQHDAWKAFNQTGAGTYTFGWHSHIATNLYGGGDGAYGSVRTSNLGLDSGGTATPQGGTRENGEWIKLHLPHKITLSFIKLLSSNNDNTAKPEDFQLYGSNDGTTWNEILRVVGANPDVTTPGTVYTPSSTPIAYNYFGLVITRTSGRINYFMINELEFYGTGVDSTPIQIGGGNIDKVANFRVYDKFVEEDQALEIWDAQKDEFGRAKSSMTLHKGRLGIGTTEPEGRLAVLDEPDPDAYGLQEYPPKPLAGYKTHIEGHGEFCVKVSSNNGDSFAGWKAFNKIFTGGEGWMTGGDPVAYTQGTGLPTSTIAVFNGKQGEWLHIELPYKIRLKKTTILQRTSSDHPRPTGSFTIWGSNDTFNWDEIITGTHTRTVADNETTGDPINRDIDTSKFYSSYVFQIHNIIVTGGNEDMGHVAEWKLFGYREQVTKQSVLHDGQLTLTKSLTVPRIGPALDADDTPHRDRLVVEYNTSTNPTFEGAVRDTSGRGNDGVLLDGAYYDATEKALVFDGSNDYIFIGNVNNPSGAWVHSYSFWVNFDRTNNEMLVQFGKEGASKSSSLRLNSSTELVWFFNSYNTTYTCSISTSATTWYHISAVYDGNLGMSVYINGVPLAVASSTLTTPANYDANEPLYIGTRVSKTSFLDGSISNFKLYDTALTAGEVKTLYDMGRCDEGHHVVNFSKTRVGIGLGDGEAPTYTLDVRGQIRSQGSLVTSFTGQHKCVPEEPVEKGLIVSAKKNQYVKLNGSLDTGKSAITIDESLPVVSLSSVAKDKACFGVVSSMEEANSLVRVETTRWCHFGCPQNLR